MRNLKLKEGIGILKGKYPEHIILVKNGLFYIATGEDAIILSKEFELSKICFAKQVCKIGILENYIREFETKLKKKNYKYIIYNSYKGNFKNIEEKFIEISRKDDGEAKQIQNLNLDCLNCNYYKKRKQREKTKLPTEKILEIYNETDKIAKGKNEFSKIFSMKKALEKDLQYISKYTNDYLNNLIDEYLMSDDNEG